MYKAKGAYKNNTFLDIRIFFSKLLHLIQIQAYDKQEKYCEIQLCIPN